MKGNILTANCEGTEEPYYKLRVELDEACIRSATSRMCCSRTTRAWVSA